MSNNTRIFGIGVTLKSKLICCKSSLEREVDLIDIVQMTSVSSWCD